MKQPCSCECFNYFNKSKFVIKNTYIMTIIREVFSLLLNINVL